MENTTIFVLIVRRILRELEGMAEAIRTGFSGINTSAEKISGQIESNAAEFNSEKNEDKPQPVISGILHRPQAEIDQEESYKTRAEGRDSRRLVIEAIALGLAALMAIANIGLWLVTRASTRIASIAAEAAQRGAKASESQAAAANASVHATVDTFRLDQRAWVGAATINGSPEVGKPFPITVMATNTGKTFARDFKMIVVVDVRPNGGAPDYSKEFSKGEDSNGLMPSKMLLSPNASDLSVNYAGNFRGNLTAGDVEALNRPDYQIFVHGRMTYRDVFNCHHWTTFCFRFVKNPFGFVNCNEHNDADENTCQYDEKAEMGKSVR